jgi:hypothetical protein
MVHALINSTPSPYLRAVTASSSPENLGDSRLPSVNSFTTQLRNALADLKQTLHPLETSSTSSNKRLHLNTLTVQLNTLDALLETAIELLQPTGRRYLPSSLLPDTSLEDIRSLFIEITQTLQHVEAHQSIDR